MDSKDKPWKAETVFKQYNKVREALNKAWARKPIKSIDIMNAYGKQSVDKKTIEELENKLREFKK